MAKKKMETETEAQATAPESKVPEEKIPQAQAPPDLTREEKDVEASNLEIREAHKNLLALQAKAVKQRQELVAKRAKEINARRASERHKRTIPVIVQRTKNRPVKIKGGAVIPSGVQVLVSPSELRRLQGKRRNHEIDLIVGEVSKGKVEETVKKARG